MIGQPRPEVRRWDPRRPWAHGNPRTPPVASAPTEVSVRLSVSRRVRSLKRPPRRSGRSWSARTVLIGDVASDSPSPRSGKTCGDRGLGSGTRLITTLPRRRLLCWHCVSAPDPAGSATQFGEGRGIFVRHEALAYAARASCRGMSRTIGGPARSLVDKGSGLL